MISRLCNKTNNRRRPSAKTGIRTIRHTTKDASLDDVLGCIITVRKAASDAGDLLSKALSCAIGDDCFEEGDADDE